MQQRTMRDGRRSTLRAVLAASVVLALAAPRADAQMAPGCTGDSCALRIEYRVLGDRLVGPGGTVVARSITPRSLRRAVTGNAAAEQLAEQFDATTRKARRWSLVSTLAAVGWIVAGQNGLSDWDSGHRTAVIASSVAVGTVAGMFSGRWNREAFARRQQAVDAFNARR